MRRSKRMLICFLIVLGGAVWIATRGGRNTIEVSPKSEQPGDPLGMDIGKLPSTEKVVEMSITEFIKVINDPRATTGFKPLHFAVRIDEPSSGEVVTNLARDYAGFTAASLLDEDGKFLTGSSKSGKAGIKTYKGDISKALINQGLDNRLAGILAEKATPISLKGANVAGKGGRLVFFWDAAFQATKLLVPNDVNQKTVSVGTDSVRVGERVRNDSLDPPEK